MSFKNKVVLVTGAGSGIGAASIELFFKEGAHVVAVDKNGEALHRVAEHCDKTKNSILKIIADVSDDDDAKRIITETIKKHEKLHVLVNCAGIIRAGKILDGTVLKSFDDLINVNLRAIINLTTLAAPYLVETKGNIVNLSSMGDSCIRMPFLAYSVIKAGVTHFTKGAALELGPSGVRVNAISPGCVRTNLYDCFGDKVNFKVFEKNTVLGKIVEPEEVADLILYLASDKAKSITGTTHVIDNGFLLKGPS